MKGTAREAAARAVADFTDKHIFAEEAALRHVTDALSPLDRGLATEMIYGTVEKLRLVDFNLEQLCKRPLTKLEPLVRAILRTALYQLFFLDRVPVYSVCDESAALARKLAGERAVGFVNGVLRSAARQKNLQYFSADSEEKEFAVNFSLSDSLAKHFIDEFGLEEAEEIMKAFSVRRPLTIVVNPLQISTPKYVKELEKNGILYEVIEENLLSVKSSGKISDLPGFKEGYFHVQDPASYFAAKLLGAKQGEKVLDLCASPGGKSFTAYGLSGGSDHFYSFDLSEKKVQKIREGAKRLGFPIHLAVQDASRHNAEWEQADRVLCDVPCSGYGVIGKKPDIRYKHTADSERLPAIQLAILENAASYLKEGGILVYSTCTLSRLENDEVVERFIKQHPNYILEDAREYLPEGLIKGQEKKTITLLPHKTSTDGFYMARIRRR